MNNLADELHHVQEQAGRVLAAIHVFEYAIKYLNYMSAITDERELGAMGENIADGMQCLMDCQRKVISQIDKLMGTVEKHYPGQSALKES
ncbi:hypothetical protein IMSAGC019_01301 [Lachnospiraceae bacterium]|nr:hypothetical protein IMSAGC019_01301 [Lachnospiraceae bacterium]